MNRIYLMIAVCAMMVGAYFYGDQHGNNKCQMQNLKNRIETNEQIQQNKRHINDKVYKTGVRDIRRILRDKYTISE